MSTPEPTTLRLEYAAEIKLDLCLMRDECVNVARALVAQEQLDEAALDECARLDEALRVAHTAIETALKSIRQSRAVKDKSAK